MEALRSGEGEGPPSHPGVGDEQRGPNAIQPSGPGWELIWDKKSLVSGQEIGMLLPHKLNPGPLAAGMSMHAPISLFFFFFVMFILQVLREIKMHPMNYFFLAASFFAFNLLFSYLVDHVDIVMAFGISSGVSLFLVISYLRLVVGGRFAVIEAGLSQVIYQILFSLAHFFEGYTGLTITIGAILTLAVVMRLTARIDWERRHRHMRMHSCMHLLCAVVPFGVTGGLIGAEKCRIDFDTGDHVLDKERITAELNRLIGEDHPLSHRWITDAELDASPELVRTMSVQPPRGSGRVRLMEVAGVDLQPCGGTHVARSGEIGRVAVSKIENKGKRNRRVNVVLVE